MSWQHVHDAADRAGDDTYVDPATGYTVLTAGYLRRRGHCCGSGCRHCPYDYEAVREPRRSQLLAGRATPPA
jgi:hypothetical protein